jgi:hypothetical protein
MAPTSDLLFFTQQFSNQPYRPIMPPISLEGKDVNFCGVVLSVFCGVYGCSLEIAENKQIII